MNKVVYILGAGFSAPLELPVMSNFIEKSKDMYFNSQKEYDHFGLIYKMIKDIASLKSFINSDLHNIEEILSILEMGYFVGDNKKTLGNYKQFLKDVINFYTPQIAFDRAYQNKNDWINYFSGEKKHMKYYGLFIANLFQIKVFQVKERGQTYSSEYYSELGDTSKDTDYGIISLNYDLVIERFVDFINLNYPIKGNMNLKLTGEQFDTLQEFNKVKIAKLHGCMSTDIIPPTWNKSSSNNSGIKKAWGLAYKMLIEANEIRIIGYSLPISDSYIKYLLSVAFKNSQHLKKIDVITIDSDGSTRDRYNKLFSFHKFQFINAKFEDFLQFAYDKERLNPKIFSNKTVFGETMDTSQIHLKSLILDSAHHYFMTGKVPKNVAL